MDILDIQLTLKNMQKSVAECAHVVQFLVNEIGRQAKEIEELKEAKDNDVPPNGAPREF